jgi:DNA-binding CsgD family transcriptional regulator
MQNTLPVEDLRGVIRLLGELAVQEGDLPFKRRFLTEGLAELVQADYWFWLHLKDDTRGDRPMPFSFLDGGFSQSQRVKFAEASTSPATAFLNARVRQGSDHHITRRRAELVEDEQWFSSELQQRFYQPAGIGEFLSSIYPLGNDTFSSMWFIRHLGRPAFTPRDVCLIHLITEEIDWLHRQGSDVPAGDRVNELSPRQKQVLFRLMAGDGMKQIARVLSLSQYTVNDHLKDIYRRFGVSGRAELLAMFFGGGASAKPASA